MSTIFDAWAQSMSPTMRVTVAWALVSLMTAFMLAMSLHFVGEFLKGLRVWNEYRDKRLADRAEMLWQTRGRDGT